MFSIVSTYKETTDSVHYLGHYIGVNPKIPFTHIATDYNGKVWGYHLEPIFDTITGKWELEDDDPRLTPILLERVVFLGHPKDSLQCYL